MQVSGDRVEMRREGVGRDDMSGVRTEKLLALGLMRKGGGRSLLGITEEVGERYRGPLVADGMKPLAKLVPDVQVT